MKRIVALLALTIALGAQAQFEKKLNTHLFLGVPFIGAQEGTVSQSIYTGYGKTPYFGGGVNYALNNKFSTQGDIRMLFTSKESGIYKLYHVTIDLQAKYNFVPADKPVSPFVIGGITLGSMHVFQKANTEVITEFTKAEDGSAVEYTQTTVEHPLIKFTMFPSLGLVAGAGVDVTYNKTIGLTFAAMYSTSNIHNNILMKQYFAENLSQFNLLYIQAGVKLSFLKSKSF